MPTRREDAVRRLRIIVALNACRRDLGGLELAAHLAEQKGCDLEALFVEEVNLINMADLPFTKEVTRSSGAEREFDQLRVGRAQRACLSQIRQVIDRLNERSSVRASLRVVRGHFVRTATAIEDDVEVLVLSRRLDTLSGQASGFIRTDLRHRTGIGNVQPSVWVIVDGSEASLRALQAAADIAVSQRTRLTVAVPGGRPDLADEVQGRVAAGPLSADPRLRLLAVEPFDAPTLLRHLRQGDCRLLVVKRHDGPLLESVAEAAECPVVLV